MKANQTSDVRGFPLNIIKGFLMLFCLVIIFLFIAGLAQVQMGLNDVLDNDLNGIDRVPLSIKGFINLLITFTLFYSLNLFIKNTLRTKKWWQKLIKTFNLDSKSYKIEIELKGKASDIFLIFYGSIVFVGLIMIVMGLIFLNTTDIIIFNMVSGMIVFLGMFPIFWGLKRYQSDVEDFMQFIIPSLFERSSKTDG